MALHSIRRVLVFLVILLTSLVAFGCARSDEPFSVMGHAALWNTPFLPLPITPENQAHFVTHIYDAANFTTPFIGFWFSLYSPAQGVISCEVNEFYDGRKTGNFSMVLRSHPEVSSDFISNVSSFGFRTGRIQPADILYNFTCWKKSTSAPIFQSAYAITVEYTDRK